MVRKKEVECMTKASKRPIYKTKEIHLRIKRPHYRTKEIHL